MNLFLQGIVACLLLTLLAGLWRILRGPSAADRMLAAQLFGTTGVAILLLMSVIEDQPALLNIALVLAILAPLTLITFVSLAGKKV